MSRHIAEALHRVRNVLERKPSTGVHDDAPAFAEWRGGTRFVTRHPNGMQTVTDMPAEFGGTGDQVTPGWLFRAGLAACAGTSILLLAAMRGIDVSLLEVRARSRSDTRGLLGMTHADGLPVDAGPGDVTLVVRIAAQGLDEDRLRELVDAGIRQSPVPNALTHATALDCQVEVVPA